MSRYIASCHLKEPGDDGNCLLLSTSSLTVIRKGKEKKYALTPLLRLEINHRLLLGPLVGGGLLCSISLIALFTLNEWPMLLLILAMGGLLLIYYGFSGVPVLTLKEDKIRYDIVLSGLNEALPAFVRFFNRLAPGLTGLVPLSFHAWFLPAADAAAGCEGSLFLDLPADHRQVKKVDLLKLPFELSFAFDGANNYVARVKQPLPEDAFL